MAMMRLGIDFGGTKIEAAVLGPDGHILSRPRAPNPGAYDAALQTIRDLVDRAEAEAGVRVAAVGVGAPGSPSPGTGLIRNANSVWLNGRPLGSDLERVLGRRVRVANDANCLALSEAADGAGAGLEVVFAAILGTGCGGGLAVRGAPWTGANGLAGEWGHTPLPWPDANDLPAPVCWCGRLGCLETYISGSAFVADYARRTGETRDGAAIAGAAANGEPAALVALDAYVSRLGRALAVVVDILDPDVIVLGGGMSNVAALYDRLPGAVAPHVFADRWSAPIRPAAHGDSSGVRGAAWLWPLTGEGD